MSELEKALNEVSGEEVKTPPTEAAQEQPKETPKDEGKEKQAEPEEREYDLPDGKKVKLKELKEWEDAYTNREKWQASNTQKAQELSAKAKAYEYYATLDNYLKENPNKAKQVLAVLEAKEEAAQDKKDDIEAELAKLDPDDPYAKGLRALRQETITHKKEIERLQTEITKRDSERQISEAQQTLNKELDDLSGKFEFADDMEKGVWRNLVLSFLKDNPRDYDSREEFLETIKNTGTKQFDVLKDLGERKIKKYLESKKTSVSTSPPVQGARKAFEVDSSNINQVIGNMLEEAETARANRKVK